MEADVISGALDIGVAVLPTVDELLDHFVFVQEKLNLLVHPSHPLAGKQSVALHELEQDAFVLFREDFAPMTALLRLASKPDSSREWCMRVPSGIC